MTETKLELSQSGRSLSPWVLIWDLFVWILILFPLVSGGVWIERPHLFLELADIRVPVLVVGAFAFVLVRGFHQPLHRAMSVRLALIVWRNWCRSLVESPLLTLSLGSVFAGVTMCGASVVRHQAFHSGAFDLGIFTNAMWNLVHGGGYVSSVKGGINLFRDHQSPLFWALAPVFAIFPHPSTLLAIQAFGLAFGAVPLYFLGRQYLRTHEYPGFLVTLPLLYWAYLPLRNANAFDFHPEVLMLPLFLAAISGLQSVHWRHRLLGASVFLLGLCAKESAGPVAAGIGLGWILGGGPQATRTWTRPLGFWVVILGIAVFYFDVRIVPSRFFGGAAYAYDDAYRQYGGGLKGLLLAPFLKPGLFWKQLLNGPRLKFLFWTLAPLGFLPLANLRAAVAALPGYLMLFSSAGDHRLNLMYHYAIEPAVGLFWALPGAIARLGQWSAPPITGGAGGDVYGPGGAPGAGAGAGPGQRSRRYRRALGIWIVFFALGAFGRSEAFRIRKNLPGAHELWLRNEFLPKVDPQQSMAASDALVPHLATRSWIHALDSLRTQDGGWASCVIYDAAVSNWPLDAAQLGAVLSELPRDGYHEEYRFGSLTVFAQPGVNCLSKGS